MVEGDFDYQAYKEEHRKRIVGLTKSAETEGKKPYKLISRVIIRSLLQGSSLIKRGDSFVVLGNEGGDGNWFAAGSFSDLDAAFNYLDQKRLDEHRYSDGGPLSATFHVFTRRGIEVRHMPGKEPPITQ